VSTAVGAQAARGQYALPGGRLEPGETVVEAALRETHEAGHAELRPDPGEVMAVYRVGLHQLLRGDSPRFESIPESDRPVVGVPLGGTVVHAPTAAVLVQLGWLGLLGRSDPVHDFEQPVFAWR
jgi:8-oxo-dGTP pyrophosphatase MutT (NUDIX family)